MKQRINLYAAGCALLILLCFFLLPFYNYISLENALLSAISGKEESVSTLGFIEDFYRTENAVYTILIVPLCGLLLLIAGLFIDRKTALGMGIASAVVSAATFVFVLYDLDETQRNLYQVSFGAGGIICCVLFIVYCLLEGLRNHLPGYQKNRSRKERKPRASQYPEYPAYGNAPQQGYPQPGYGYPQQPRQDYPQPGYSQQPQAVPARQPVEAVPVPAAEAEKEEPAAPAPQEAAPAEPAAEAPVAEGVQE